MMVRSGAAPTKAQIDLGCVRAPPTKGKGKESNSRSMPPESMYHRSPVFGDDDAFWSVFQDFSEEGEPVEKPITTGEEPTEGQIVYIEGDSFLRLRIERGDFPWCFVQLMGPSGGAGEWEKWTDFILANSSYVETLKSAGLYDTVRAFRTLRLNKNLDHLNLILSRWSIDTHTIITGWGEITFTLEDVVELTSLDYVGEFSLADPCSEEEEEAIVNVKEWLANFSSWRRSLVDASNKKDFPGWQRYCFRDYANSSVSDGEFTRHKNHLAAYTLALISQFLMPGSQGDGPVEAYVDLAVRLSLGKKIPLAAMILGNLYSRLDHIVLGFKTSAGRFDLRGFLPMSLIQMWIFEHFPHLAPPRNDLKKRDNVLCPRAHCWDKKSCSRRLHNYIDDEKSFHFRPYSSVPKNCMSSSFYGPKTTMKSFTHQSQPVGRHMYVLCNAYPSWLPTYNDVENGVSRVYSPQRCARQCGFDQQAPRLAIVKRTYKESFRRFLESNLLNEACHMGQLFFPATVRHLKRTLGARSYWASQSVGFLSYLQSTQERTPPSELVPLAKNNKLMKTPPARDDDWIGPQSKYIGFEDDPPKSGKEDEAVTTIPSKGAMPLALGKKRVQKDAKEPASKRKIIEKPLVDKHVASAVPPQQGKGPKQGKGKDLAYVKSILPQHADSVLPQPSSEMVDIDGDSAGFDQMHEVEDGSSSDSNSQTKGDEHVVEHYDEPVDNWHDMEPEPNLNKLPKLDDEEIVEESEGDDGVNDQAQMRSTPEINTGMHTDEGPNSILPLVNPDIHDSGMTNNNLSHIEPSVPTNQRSDFVKGPPSALVSWKGHKVSEPDWKLLVAIDAKFPDTFTEMGFHSASGWETGLSVFCQWMRRFLSTIIGQLGEDEIVSLRGSLQDAQSMLKCNLSWALKHLAKVVELKSKNPAFQELVDIDEKVEAASAKEEELERQLKETRQMRSDLHTARETKVKEVEARIGRDAMTLVNCSVNLSLIPRYTPE